MSVACCGQWGVGGGATGRIGGVPLRVERWDRISIDEVIQAVPRNKIYKDAEGAVTSKAR